MGTVSAGTLILVRLKNVLQQETADSHVATSRSLYKRIIESIFK